jgi:opacity protein-like surface antigen
MRIFRSVSVVVLVLCFALPAAAQYVGVLQSAETNDRGTFKLMAAPIMVFGKDGADNTLGLAARAGYGFTDRFDAEAKLGLFDGGTYIGADGEFWLMKGVEKDTGMDFSIAGGIHWVSGDVFDVMGFDVTPLLSAHLNEVLELCGALDMSFESVQDVPEGFDSSYTSLHLVPGIEYRLSDSFDLVGEIGIALNDDSSTYAGAGIAYYIR